MKTSVRKHRRPDHWVPKAAFSLAVVGSVALGWLVFGRSDASDVAAATTSAATVATTVKAQTSTTALATTTVPTVAETTLVTTTLAVETTVPAETTAVPVPPPADAIVPDVNPPIFIGRGNHQVMNDPLPSGVAFAQVRTTFTTAEHLADLIAAHDWFNAQALLPADRLGTQGLALAYGSIGRYSLLLLDAKPDGAGYTMLIAALTNENDGTQTSYRCLQWYADANAVDILSEKTFETFQQSLGPAAVRASPTEDAKIRASCVWG